MPEPPAFWDAVHGELRDVYKFAEDLRLQPAWDIRPEIAVHVALAGRFSAAENVAHPSTLTEFLADATDVIEAGATGVAIDYGWIEDDLGRRLDRDLPPVEAYRAVLDPLRSRFGWAFVSNCNVLNGTTFAECLSPATEGLAEVAPCAAGHPDEFMLPAVIALQESGVSPEIGVHSSGEIELAKRKLIDTGILRRPYNFIVLFGLPFNTGRTLLSGTWVRNAQDLAAHLFLMVSQLRSIDPECVITVCAAGRAGLHTTTLATMLGLDIRVGTEDTFWRSPLGDELLSGNLEMFIKARAIAEALGRRVATADEYRRSVGLPARHGREPAPGEAARRGR